MQRPSLFVQLNFPENRMSYINDRIESFKHASRGVITLVRETPNAIIQLIAAIIAVVTGFILRISTLEWVAIVVVIAIVLSLEAVNTALEKLSDYACNKEIHPTIKKIKDISAAAVLIAAIGAFIVGILIFLPKIVVLI